MTRGRRGPASRLLGVLAAASLAPLVVEGAVAAVGPVPVAETFPARGATLSASTADLAALVFEGVVSVETTDGPVEVLRLSSGPATLTGLALEVGCRPVAQGLGGMSTLAATAEDGTSSAPEGVTILARSVTATSAGAAVAWTPASPPPAEQLGDVTLADLTVELAGLQAPALTMPGLRESTEFCTP